MVTAIIGQDLYKTELIATGHTLFADEPEEAGGRDLGPSPVQFLQLSLASCTAITLRMYAHHKNIALNKIRVEVNAERAANKTILHRHIYFEGLQDETQHEKLLAIANACPLHKTLTHPIEIKTSVIPL